MTIYTPINSPAGTKVFADGIEVHEAFYADTERGIIKYYPRPLRLDVDRGGVRSETITGVNVTIKKPLSMWARIKAL